MNEKKKYYHLLFKIEKEMIPLNRSLPFIECKFFLFCLRLFIGDFTLFYYKIKHFNCVLAQQQLEPRNSLLLALGTCNVCNSKPSTYWGGGGKRCGINFCGEWEITTFTFPHECPHEFKKQNGVLLLLMFLLFLFVHALCKV